MNGKGGKNLDYGNGVWVTENPGREQPYTIWIMNGREVVQFTTTLHDAEEYMRRVRIIGKYI